MTTSNNTNNTRNSFNVPFSTIVAASLMIIANALMIPLAGVN